MTFYPEKIPNASSKPYSSFYFNLHSSKDVKNNLQNQVDSLDQRIEKIVDHFTIDGAPIVRLILGMTDDRKELKRLAKAIDRVADLIDAKNQIAPKLEIIKYAEKDPNWFASTFGDFSADIELGLDSINTLDSGDFNND